MANNESGRDLFEDSDDYYQDDKVSEPRPQMPIFNGVGCFAKGFTQSLSFHFAFSTNCKRIELVKNK